MIFPSQMCLFSPAHAWFFTYSLANYGNVYLDESNIIRWLLPLKLHTHRAVAILNGCIIQSRALPSGRVPSSQQESSSVPILLLMLPVHLTFHLSLIHEQDLKILKLSWSSNSSPTRRNQSTSDWVSSEPLHIQLQTADDWSWEQNNSICKSREAFLFFPQFSYTGTEWWSNTLYLCSVAYRTPLMWWSSSRRMGQSPPCKSLGMRLWCSAELSHGHYFHYCKWVRW